MGATSEPTPRAPVFDSLEPRLLLSGSIEGQVFDDINGDGVHDAGEPGQSGMVVELVDPATDTVVDTQTTADIDLDANGAVDAFTEAGLYSFAAVANGDYEVRQVAAEGWLQTAPAGSYGGELELIQQFNNGQDGAELTQVYHLTVSPDGRFVYASNGLSNDPAVTVFRRDLAIGALTLVQTLQDTGGAAMDGPTTVAISPDGLHAYVTGAYVGTLNVFERDVSTGLLTHLQTLQDGVDGVYGLSGAREAVISPDGQNIYVAAAEDNTVSVFFRDAATGLLTPVQPYPASPSELWDAQDVAISPDGQNVYVISRPGGIGYERLVEFTRDVATGELTLLHQLSGYPLGGANDLRVSPDGRHVYVTVGGNDNCLAVFDRDEISGALTLVTTYASGVGEYSADELQYPRAVGISADGQYVFVVSTYVQSMMVMRRDPVTGELSRVTATAHSVGGWPEPSVVVAPDGKHVYATSPNEGYVAVFEQLIEPGSNTATVAGAAVSDVDFGNTQWITISGQVFLDTNGNGQRDIGEDGTNGHTVEIVDPASGLVVAKGFSRPFDLDGDGVDEEGIYFAQGLPAGDYQVRVTGATDFVQSYPVNGELVPVTLTVGQNLGNIDLGVERATSQISGQVFADLNANGLFDGDEVGIDDIVIELVDLETGSIVASAITHSHPLYVPAYTHPRTGRGHYAFEGLVQGNYELRQVLPAGWTPTAPSATVHLAADEALETVTLRILGHGGLGDVDNNGVINDADIDLLAANFGAGVNTRFDVDGDGDADADDVDMLVTDIIKTVYADANLDGLVNATDLAGLKAGFGGPSSWATGDFNADGLTNATDLAIFKANFGGGAIEGQVWHDVDANWSREASEVGVDGRTVELLSAATGLVIATTVTTSVDLDGDGAIDPMTESGLYVFENIPVGRYEVRQVLPDGWSQTVASLDPAVAQLPDVRFVQSYWYEHVWDFFNFEPVWNDYAFIELFDAGRWPTMWKMSDSYYNDVWVPTRVVGGENGELLVRYVPDDNPNVYWIVFEDGHSDWVTWASADEFGDVDVRIIEDYARGELHVHAEEVNSTAWHAVMGPDGSLAWSDWGQADDLTFEMDSVFALQLGQTVSGMDLGTSAQMRLSGQVFEDSNGNGLRDAAEMGMDGWTVQAVDATTSSVIATVTTSSHDIDGDGAIDPRTESGLYEVKTLHRGTIELDAVIPNGGQWRLSAPDDPHVVSFAVGEYGGYDFGLVERAIVHAQVFEDLDGDGIRDAEESGLNGWTVRLTNSATGQSFVTVTTDIDLDGNGAIDPSTESGVYYFGGTILLPGDYTIRQTLQSGWVQTTPATAALTISILSGQTITAAAFGNQHVHGVLAGQVFDDLNGNGVRDGGEVGINGRTVELVDPASAAVIATAVTADEDFDRNGVIDPAAETGRYSFIGLAQGDYEVRYVAPAGWQQTSPVTGGELPLVAEIIDGVVTIHEFDPADGTIIRSFDPPQDPQISAFQGLAASADSIFYVDSGDMETATVWEIDRATGVVIDSDVLTFSAFYAIKGLAYLDGLLYIQWPIKIAVWDPASDLWVRTMPIATTLAGGITGAGYLGVLYATDTSGQILTIDPSDGSVLAIMDPGVGPLDGGLAFVDGRLLAVAADMASLVYEIDPLTGVVTDSYLINGGNGYLVGLGGDGVAAPTPISYTLELDLDQRLYELDFGTVLL